MADGNTGQREIVVDLSVTGARTLRDAATGNWVKITRISVSGKTGASAQSIVLRSEVASTGPILYSLLGTAATEYEDTNPFASGKPVVKGLYLDNIANAWTAGSLLIIYTS
jgi:hypothetical protein